MTQHARPSLFARLFRRGRVVGLLAVALLLALATTTAACSSSQPTSTAGATDATIIDVRTPAEYADGHLQGAINIDIYASDFAAKIAALPKDATYIVYCRTGVRAGNAVTQMKAIGISHVTSGGGYQDASKSTGLPIVK